MPKLFAATIALFLLLLSAGYGLSQAARSIPWNCDDWQPYAHENRPTAILESLAENRGKTLYCGIDQSDTFAKAETWAAGKDRNERDDTVYWGERGSFRGFIAAQEGWLTEGESGITGQSIATIFEFPREKKKRRRYKTVVVDEQDILADSNRLAYGPMGGAGNGNNQAEARSFGESDYNQNPPAVDWPALALAAAVAHCRSLDYNRVKSGSAATVAATENWRYNDTHTGPTYFRSHAGKTRQWTATCQKTERRRR